MKNRLLKPLSALMLFSVLFACNTGHEKETATAPDFLASNIDSTVKPGDDFFMFANNGWFKSHPIPASEQGNGLWQLIRDTINAQVKEICEQSASVSDAEEGSPRQKIGDFFYSGMDSSNINAVGVEGIREELDAIDAIRNMQDLVRVGGSIHMKSSAPFFSLYVGQDDKISSKYALFIYQGGLNLPDKRFYLDTDERSETIRKKFHEYSTKMFSILGYDSGAAEKSTNDVFALETQIAKASRNREDTRDPQKNYNKMPLKALEALAPSFPWNVFLGELGLPNADTVIIGQPEVISQLSALLKSNDITVWKDYLKLHLLKGVAPYLDDNTDAIHFAFYRKALRGIEEPKPRWKRVTDQTNRSMGELIGQVYVKDYLPAGTREKLTQIGNDIRDVYAERIKNLDWMSEETKAKALDKLNTIVMKVGYPDKWKDMSMLDIDRTSYVRNVINANIWEMNYMIAKYGKPVDRTEWEMTPQTYNAYYNPSNNEIVVPGCNIIVPGYERTLADDAILYSIIGGSTFGHEITHGFDDQGCQYDKDGNLNNWWTQEDSDRFKEKTRLVVKQFDEYVVVDSLTINGELTLGENIADIGGIMMGYEAFKKTSQYQDNVSIAGLSPDQRFFLGYALAWMINDRPEAMASQVKSDVHSPAKFRVIGPLSNMPEFHRTFEIKEGDFMWRPDSLQARIW